VSSVAAQQKKLLFALRLLSWSPLQTAAYVGNEKSPTDSNIKLPFVGLVGIVTDNHHRSCELGVPVIIDRD
jgi:hypothetical protein